METHETDDRPLFVHVQSDVAESSTAPLWWAVAVSNKAAPGSFSNVCPWENPATFKERLPEDVSVLLCCRSLLMIDLQEGRQGHRGHHQLAHWPRLLRCFAGT